MISVCWLLTNYHSVDLVKSWSTHVNPQKREQSAGINASLEIVSSFFDDFFGRSICMFFWHQCYCFGETWNNLNSGMNKPRYGSKSWHVVETLEVSTIPSLPQNYSKPKLPMAHQILLRDNESSTKTLDQWTASDQFIVQCPTRKPGIACERSCHGLAAEIVRIRTPHLELEPNWWSVMSPRHTANRRN